MQLKTRLPHLRGKKIQVGNEHIAINDNGIIDDVDDELAQTLLGSHGNAWSIHNPADTGNPPPRRDRMRVKPIFTKAADRNDGDMGELDEDTLANDPLLASYGAGVPEAPDAPDPDASEVHDPSTGAKTKRQPRTRKPS